MSQDPKPFQKTAVSITRAIGSPASILIHTVIFAASFLTVLLGVFSFDRMLLVLTTILSLEAIYLSLFIQMTVNYTTESIVEVEQDIDEIQGDIDEIQEDVEEMQEDVEEMSEEPEGKTLEEIHAGLQKLIQDVEHLQNRPS